MYRLPSKAVPAAFRAGNYRPSQIRLCGGDRMRAPSSSALYVSSKRAEYFFVFILFEAKQKNFYAGVGRPLTVALLEPVS